ncbi:hypothetical protein B0H15DRAFT_803721 [Mycena belliarum]|uniref:Uncharacterized protein n=1 Tax=Mycena belliarum TaxID=1033014 RepID=A0AAD6TVX4_9AGAR|nr:hypothetical protein B0H15DRAFT_803721 [Mycena belliae]
MPPLAPTTVESSVTLHRSSPPDRQVSVQRRGGNSADRATQRYKVLLFATGEAAPFIVDIPKAARSLSGSPTDGLEYIPWLMGSATCGAASHSCLELSTVAAGEGPMGLVVILLDQDQPGHLVLPNNQCIGNITGGGVSWKGNVLAVRRVDGQVRDVQLEHIAPITEYLAMYEFSTNISTD